MRLQLFLLVALLLSVASAHGQTLTPPLTFSASFNGTLDAVARGNGKPASVDGPVAYRPGRGGQQALLCGEGGAAVNYATAGNLRASSGTVEMWVCPLDWTGKEDEFHVFLEALNPGWLVFYRYYQGGILTLTGTDGSHYTSAASPPINWKPGEWHHLAGTWRARRLEVYIDGKLEGFSAGSLTPEKLADSFVVGDRPWHVARKRQTLVQDLKIYSAPLDPESIALAAKGEPIRWQPKLLVDSKANPDTDTLAVNVDAAGLVGDQGTGRTARVELGSKGQDVVAQATITRFAYDVGSAELSLARVPPGVYDLRAVLQSDTGAEVARTSSPFTKPGPPVWSGNKLGIADKVLTPWTALKTDRAAVACECWGRRYEFGPMLRQVRSQDTDLLNQPVSLEAVIAGKPVSLSGLDRRVQLASDTKATFTGEAQAAGLRATFKHQVEYDGFTWTDVALEAAQPVKVDELRLTWKMPRDQATLMNADTMAWVNNPAGAIKPEGRTLPFVPYFWVGNEDRGLSWYAETTRNWVMSKDQPAIEIKPEGEQVLVTIRLIAAPTEIRGNLDYGFGMMATPVRPYPNDAMAWRMTPGVRPTFDIIWPNGNMKYYGYTEPDDPAKLTEKVKADHAQGCKVIPYINLNFASAGIPEWQYYGSRWADPGRIVTPSDVAAMGFASMGTCPNRRDWQDFILWRINEMIDKYQVDGIYIDCWGPAPCRCPECAWKDAAGTVQPTYPVRAYREILRRVYTLFRERQTAPLLMNHMSTEVDMPMLSFTDTILDGEQFGGNATKDDYLNVLSPDQFRAEFLGRNMGPVEFFLPEFKGAENVKNGTPNLVAYTLLHGVNVWPIWSDGAVWNKAYEALDQFDFAHAKFLPYWKSASWAERPPDVVSAYVGKNGALLIDMNTLDGPGQAHLTLDLARLEMKTVSSATDVLSGEELKLEGNVLTIPQEPHQGRVIWLKP